MKYSAQPSGEEFILIREADNVSLPCESVIVSRLLKHFDRCIGVNQAKPSRAVLLARSRTQSRQLEGVAKNKTI
jgi:hypothetical protein